MSIRFFPQFFHTLSRIITEIGVAVACLLCIAPVCAQESATTLRYDVKFDAPKELQDLLTGNLDILRWRDNPQLDSDHLLRLYRAAPEQIKTIISTAGYFQAKVTPTLERDSSPWKIHFAIEPGPAMLINTVDLRFLKKPPPNINSDGDSKDGREENPVPALEDSETSAELLSNWKLPEGEIFRQAQWESAKRALLRETSLQRYPRAQLVYSEAKVDVQSSQANLLVVLARGPEVHFGKLDIIGLQRYQASIIHNLNTIKEGDIYNEQALLDLQQNLQDSNYFSNVVVTAQFSPEMDGAEGSVTVPVQVKLTEYKRRKVDAGIGYSTNTGNRVQLNLEDLSLFGQQAKFGTTLETKGQNVAVDFFAPTTSQGYHDSYGAAVTRTSLAGEVTVQSRLAYHRRWGNQTLAREFQFEFISEHKTLLGQTSTSTKSVPINYEVIWRHLDSLLQPKRGYLVQAKIGGAPLPLFGGQSFVRSYLRGQYYYPIGKQGIVLTRGEFGALGSRGTDNIPSTYLFRAGGDQSVRGYGYQQLGVREGDAINGGRYLATASL
ncbi:MAG: BamA/TamA family outer membrane protein, partial [Burkholderiales bacterium]|nr:BamA/TamA family outer membrane protein [Burkholderiales bacterium]